MMIAKGRRGKFLVPYYGLLLLILFMHGAAASPNMVLRALFLLAFVVPLCVVKYNYTALLLPMFIIIAVHAGDNYLPFMEYQYTSIAIVVALVQGMNIFKSLRNVPVYLLLLFVHVSFVNLFNTQSFENVSNSFILLVILLCFVQCGNEKYVSDCLFSFVIMSLFLSIFYLFYKEQFGDNAVSTDGDFDVYGWMDRNYFSTVLGMGVISSVLLLTWKRELGRNIKNICLIAIAVSILTMIILASRGALLAVGVSMFVYTIIGKFPTKYKILGLLSLPLFLFIIYLYGYLDFLIYRMTEEESLTDGSGRTITWGIKIGHFFDDLNPLQNLVGIGFQKGLVLGSGNRPIGFHNDFVAFVVDYGILGIILFLTMLIHPILRSTILRKETIVMTLYLALCSFSLEGFSSGRISYFLFYIPVLLLSRVKSNTKFL